MLVVMCMHRIDVMCLIINMCLTESVHLINKALSRGEQTTKKMHA